MIGGRATSAVSSGITGTSTVSGDGITTPERVVDVAEHLGGRLNDTDRRRGVGGRLPVVVGA